MGKNVLNNRQRLFISNLVAGMNQTDAYLNAGYKTNRAGAGVAASNLLGNEVIQDELDRLLGERKIDNNGGGGGDVEGMIQNLQANGYLVTREAQKQDYHFDGVKLFRLDDCSHSRFGFVSDMHMGSKFQQVSNLYNFYKICDERGVDAILNCGDISDGQRMYSGQEYEVFKHGADAQAEYIIEKYPDAPGGVETFLLGGNHDESHYTRGGGHDIIKRICKERGDIHNVGMHQGWYHFGDSKIKLMHPTGGVSYARSYKMQKIIEQMPPKGKPDILLLGHFHVTDFLMAYRGVMGFQLPCFQSQTPYLAKKGLYPELGGVVVDVFWVDESPVNGIKRVTADWVPYSAVEDDW